MRTILFTLFWLALASHSCWAGAKWYVSPNGNDNHAGTLAAPFKSLTKAIDAAAPGRQYLSEQLPWEEAELQAEPSPVKPFHENILDALSGKALAIVTPESAAEVVRVTNLIQSAAEVELP